MHESTRIAAKIHAIQPVVSPVSGVPPSENGERGRTDGREALPAQPENRLSARSEPRSSTAGNHAAMAKVAGRLTNDSPAIRLVTWLSRVAKVKKTPNDVRLLESSRHKLLIV